MGPNVCSRPTPAALFAIGSPLGVKMEHSQSIDKRGVSQESGQGEGKGSEKY